MTILKWDRGLAGLRTVFVVTPVCFEEAVSRVTPVLSPLASIKDVLSAHYYLITSQTLYYLLTMHFKTSPLLILLSYLSRAAADSGYWGSCNSITVSFALSTRTWEISGNCRDTSGIYNVGNSINIDSCFINASGNLVAQLW